MKTERAQRLKKLKRRAIAVGMGCAAGICALLATQQDDADLSAHGEERVQTVETVEGHAVPGVPVRMEIEAEETRAGRLRRAFYALNDFLKALVTLPLMLAGKAVLFGLKKLLRLSHPLFSALLGFLTRTLLLFGLFALVWKLLFPDRPLSELFKNGRWKWLLAGAALLTAADRLLVLLDDDWRWIRMLLWPAVTIGVTALLYSRFFKGVPAPEKPKKWIEIPGTV